MSNLRPPTGPPLAFGSLGLVVSVGLLLALVEGRVFAQASPHENVLVAFGAIAAAAMSIVVLMDAAGPRRRRRRQAR